MGAGKGTGRHIGCLLSNGWNQWLCMYTTLVVYGDIAIISAYLCK